MKLAAAIAGALAIYRAVAYEMPLLFPVAIESGVPYAGQPVAATAIIILAALVAMVVTTSDEVRQVAGSLAILITAHLVAFELDPAPAVAAWAGLAVSAWALQRQVRGTLRLYHATSALLLVTGVVVTLVTSRHRRGFCSRVARRSTIPSSGARQRWRLARSHSPSSSSVGGAKGRPPLTGWRLAVPFWPSISCRSGSSMSSSAGSTAT